MVFKDIEIIWLKDNFWFLTVRTMSGSCRKSSSSKDRSQELEWDATEDLDCVIEPGLQDEHTIPWTCTTYKAYVKMKHLVKLWPRSQAVISVPQWKGLTESCTGDHFRQQYFEIHTAARLPCSKPKMMNYSNMAMVWAKIVLHKDMTGTLYMEKYESFESGLMDDSH